MGTLVRKVSQILVRLIIPTRINMIDAVCLSIFPGLWDLVVHHLNGTGLHVCCAPPTCVVHHRPALCTTRRLSTFVISYDRGGAEHDVVSLAVRFSTYTQGQTVYMSCCDVCVIINRCSRKIIFLIASICLSIQTYQLSCIVHQCLFLSDFYDYKMVMKYEIKF